MLANQMFPAALGVFIIVLVQDLGFAALLWGVIQFLPRVFDAITDPVMGFISDNTRSKWGRRRQYVFIGAILMGIAYIAMWQLHKGDGVTYNFIYFLSWSLVFYLGLTIFSVPYVAMGYEISEDFHERTQIMAVAQFIGQWAWVVAPWFWVILYDPSWFPEGADAGVAEGRGTRGAATGAMGTATSTGTDTPQSGPYSATGVEPLPRSGKLSVPSQAPLSSHDVEAVMFGVSASAIGYQCAKSLETLCAQRHPYGGGPSPD